MKIKKFIRKLNDLYGDKHFPVKYYAQPTSFSFNVYPQKEAFSGEPIYVSPVYHLWDSEKEVRKEIMQDVLQKLQQLNATRKITGSTWCESCGGKNCIC